MKKLTKAEEEVMQVVWILKECTVGDIRTYFAEQSSGVKPPHSTISTMMKILSDKGFTTFKAYGRTHVYTATINKEEYGRQRVDNLVSNYFGGSANQLVSFLIKENDMDMKDLGDLLQRLEKDKNPS